MLPEFIEVNSDYLVELIANKMKLEIIKSMFDYESDPEFRSLLGTFKEQYIIKHHLYNDEDVKPWVEFFDEKYGKADFHKESGLKHYVSCCTSKVLELEDLAKDTIERELNDRL